MIFQNSLGIEICEDRVLIVYLKTTFTGICLKAYGDYPLNSSLQIKDINLIIIDIITDFIKLHQIQNCSVHIGIPRDQAIIRTLRFPSAVKENLLSTLKYEMDKYLPLSPDDVLFDYSIINNEKDVGFFSILLIVVKKSEIRFWLEIQERFNISVSGIEIASTAICNYFGNMQGRNSDPIGFIDLRSKFFEIGVIKNRQLIHSKIVMISDVQNGFSDQVVKELEMLQESGIRCKRYYVFDDGISQSGLKHLAAEAKYEVVPIEHKVFNLPSDHYIPACGLALKGLKKVPIQINLLPVENRKRPKKLEMYVMLTLILLVILSGLAWSASFVIRNRLYQKELAAEMKQLSAEISKVEHIQNEIQMLESRIKYLEIIEKKRYQALVVLKELSLVIPKSAWISDYNYSGKDVKISGQAETASELISILENSPLFKDVVFISTITKEKEGRERFNISLEVN